MLPVGRYILQFHTYFIIFFEPGSRLSIQLYWRRTLVLLQQQEAFIEAARDGLDRKLTKCRHIIIFTAIQQLFYQCFITFDGLIYQYEIDRTLPHCFFFTNSG